MTRTHDGDRRFEELVERLADELEPPSDDELRELARAATAEPRAAVPERAGAVWPLRPRLTAAVVAVSLLLASGLGFGLGSSLTPSGSATDGPSGLGFVPERGWQVVRSGFEASAERPSFAIASNVPLAQLDMKLALGEDFPGYPGQTLQALGPNGIVLVASFDLRGVHEATDESFPRRTLPLRMRDAAASVRPSVYFPRARPLAWYELRAAVGEHNVIVQAFFGSPRPSEALLRSAQQQLDRLVIGATQATARLDERALPLRPAEPAAGSRIVDRTFSCRPATFGGVGDLDVYVTPPREFGGVGGRGPATTIPAHLIVHTNTFNARNVLFVVRPQPYRQQGFLSNIVRGIAGVFVQSRRCTPLPTKLRLSPQGLLGPPTIGYRDLDCPVRGPVVVRVRSVLRSAVEWRRIDGVFDGVRQPVVQTKVAVRTQQGKEPLAYMEHDAKGRTKLWFSGACS